MPPPNLLKTFFCFAIGCWSTITENSYNTFKASVQEFKWEVQEPAQVKYHVSLSASLIIRKQKFIVTCKHLLAKYVTENTGLKCKLRLYLVAELKSYSCQSTTVDSTKLKWILQHEIKVAVYESDHYIIYQLMKLGIRLQTVFSLTQAWELKKKSREPDSPWTYDLSHNAQML